MATPKGSDPLSADITAAQLEREELSSDLPSREQRIASAAFRRAQERDFAPGFELDDWLSAEREIDEQIAAEQLRASTPSMR
jgi:hypothetical protein